MRFLKGKLRDKGNGHVKFEWNQIDDNIFVGTNECCKMHFDEDLLGLGVNGNVSMEEERIDSPNGVDYYLWLPTKDHTAPTFDKLMVGVKAIDEIIDNGGKVYIHCKNGHGRGPTMAAAYYIYKGMTSKEAIGLVEAKRDEAHIESVQVKVLKELSEYLNK